LITSNSSLAFLRSILIGKAVTVHSVSIGSQILQASSMSETG
jgi:hypothetical protein